MILAQNSRLLSYLCKMARSLGNLEVRFDSNSRQLSLGKNCTTSVRVKWRYYLLAMMSNLFVFQCVQKADVARVESVLAWIFLIVLHTAATYTFEVRRKAIEI